MTAPDPAGFVPDADTAGGSQRADRTDARLLRALVDDPRATTSALAQRAGVSRNTAQARLGHFAGRGVITSYERCVDPAALGYPLTAYVMVTVTQRMLDQVAEQFAAVPEVVEVLGLSGTVDLLVRVVARDGDDLYRIAGQLLAADGVQRTETSLVMRRLVDTRMVPLLDRAVT